MSGNRALRLTLIIDEKSVTNIQKDIEVCVEDILREEQCIQRQTTNTFISFHIFIDFNQ